MFTYRPQLEFEVFAVRESGQQGERAVVGILEAQRLAVEGVVIGRGGGFVELRAVLQGGVEHGVQGDDLELLFVHVDDRWEAVPDDDMGAVGRLVGNRLYFGMACGPGLVERGDEASQKGVELRDSGGKHVRGGIRVESFFVRRFVS